MQIDLAGSSSTVTAGRIAVQLSPHQPLDDGVGDELVPVDAAIDDKPGGTMAA